MGGHNDILCDVHNDGLCVVIIKGYLCGHNDSFVGCHNDAVRTGLRIYTGLNS